MDSNPNIQGYWGFNAEASGYNASWDGDTKYTVHKEFKSKKAQSILRIN